MRLNPRRTMFRGWCGGLLGLHLLGAALVPLADARLEAAVQATVVHVEDPHDGACAPAHDHEHCVLCQQLAHGAGLLATVVHAVAGPEAGTIAPATANELVPRILATSSLSRAPPLA